MNLTANQEMGILTEGEDNRPLLAQIYNPAYIARLLEACGFVASHPMRTLVKRDLPSMDPEVLLAPKHRGLLDDPRYCFRALDRRKFAAEVDAVREVLNDAMADNYLFVPLTPSEAQFQLGPLKLVLDPELVRIAEHDGKPVGIALGVPDVVPLLQKMKGRLWPTGWFHFLRKKKYLEDFAVIIILVKKAYQAQGVIRVLTYQLYKAGKEGGYKNAGGTWIGDDNEPSLKAAGAFGMERLHRLHMYEKAL